VDLIKEYDGLFAILLVEFRLFYEFLEIFFFARHPGQTEKLRIESLGDDMSYGRLAAPRRSSENHRGDFAALQKYTERLILSHQMHLADEFIQGFRSQK
jgi:hypothetical protein